MISPPVVRGVVVASVSVNRAVGFGAGVALTAAFFTWREPPVSSAPAQTAPLHPLQEILRTPERFVGRSVTVEGERVSELGVEFQQVHGVEWCPIYNPVRDTVTTEELSYNLPRPVGYWYELGAQNESPVTKILVFSEQFAEQPPSTTVEGHERISLTATVGLQQDGSPFLICEAPGDSGEDLGSATVRDDDHLSSGRPWWFAHLELPQALPNDREGLEVPLPDLVQRITDYRGRRITTQGELTFIGVEASIGGFVHGITPYQGPQSLRPLDADGNPLGELATQVDPMRSRVIRITGHWYCFTSPNDPSSTLLVRSEKVLPRNVDSIRGFIREIEGSGKQRLYLELEEYGTRRYQ
jgi:hypothetical protein